MIIVKTNITDKSTPIFGLALFVCEGMLPLAVEVGIDNPEAEADVEVVDTNLFIFYLEVGVADLVVDTLFDEEADASDLPTLEPARECRSPQYRST